MTQRVSGLNFSTKYGSAHSLRYHQKHRTGIVRRLSNWREQCLARKALRLAGDPGSVLDLPSGAGRFWSTLAEKPGRRLYGADNSLEMLRVALARQLPGISRRICLFQASAFSIPLPDRFVENVFSMRLLHHFTSRQHRMTIYREFARVSSSSVCVSLWVDGNLQARRRRRVEARRTGERERNRAVLPRYQAEEEFREAGLEIVGHVDFFKLFSIWRIYVLRTRSQ